jgi:hypothetical protein
LWHLLSLDAPTVAALWFALAARSSHLQLHACDVAALALGTWMLYVLDRMLDARLGANEQKEERHRFHGEHWIGFLWVMACAAPLLILLLMHMEPRLLRAYLLLGLGLAGYLAVVHTGLFARAVPKELAVGAIFAAAIFMPECVAGGRAVILQALSFGALCWINCVLIYQREHCNLHAAHGSTRFVVRHARLLLGMVMMAGIYICITSRMAGASVVLSAVAMLLLHHASGRMGRLPFRVAADAALLTPVVFLFLR